MLSDYRTSSADLRALQQFLEQTVALPAAPASAVAMQTTSFIVARCSLASISEAVGSLFCQLSEQLLLTLAALVAELAL